MDIVSVIIVNYNGKKWLKKCFDSLLAQTYQNFEIIFVDNNSKDDSIHFLEKNYKDNRIKIIRNTKNSGFAGGNNLGIQKAKGEYILLLNNDVWVEKYFLDKIFKFYTNNKYDVVAPWEDGYESHKKYKYSLTIDLLGHPCWFEYKKNRSFYLMGVCLFFKKNFYIETKGLDNNFFMYFEETDWFWRLNLLDKKYSYVKDLFVNHAGSGSSSKEIIKHNSFLWRNQNTLQMLLKNYSLLSLIFVIPLYLTQNIIEMVAFLIILKPKISLTYLQGWLFNIKYLRRTLKKRRWIQSNRTINDLEIMKKMYLRSGKLRHLLKILNVKI